MKGYLNFHYENGHKLSENLAKKGINIVIWIANTVADDKVIEILLAHLIDRLSQLFIEQNLTQTSKLESSLTATITSKL